VINLSIQGTKRAAIIDTGAAISLIRTEYLDLSQIKLFDTSNLRIQAANGTLLNSRGCVTLPVDLGKITANVLLHVVDDLPHGMLLGSNFLYDKDLPIRMINDLRQLRIRKGNHWVSIPIRIFKRHPAQFGVRIEEDVTIPANSAIILQGKRIPLGNEVEEPLPGKLGLVEGYAKFAQDKKLEIAKATVVLSEPWIPVNFYNATSKDVQLFKDTLVATVEMIDETENLIELRIPDNTQSDFTKDEFLKKVNINGELSKEERKKVEELLWKWKSVFASNPLKPGVSGIAKHQINTGNAKPVNQAPYPTSMKQESVIQEEVSKLIANDIATDSKSPWASPVVLVRKKDGSIRFCVDYRKLNDLTVKDAYPMPKIDDILDTLTGNFYFSTLDCASGYWQIEIDENDREKTAFITKSGLYEFKVMPFGLTNAPATFQRAMNMILAGLKWSICLIYLDDIIVFSKTFEEQLERLEAVFGALLRHNIHLKVEKCHFMKSEVKYLGFVVSKDGVKADPAKTDAINKYPIPTNVSELRSFIGLCSFYRRFVRNFADITAPLNALLKKNIKFKWTPECQKAFVTLKLRLTSPPVLAFPRPELPYKLVTDASDHGLGAVLSQNHDGIEKVIAYGSRTLHGEEMNYSTTERECLGVVWATNHYRQYLIDKEFEVDTDHQALTWLHNMRGTSKKFERWCMLLSEFTMKIKHKKGINIPHADALSRAPLSAAAVLSVVVADRIAEFRRAQHADPSLDVFRNKAALLYKEVDESFIIKDDLVYRVWTPQSRNLKGRTFHQLVVPRNLRKDILFECHDGLLSGHLGVDKTLFRLQERFWWPGIRKDCHYYVMTCDSCNSKKTPIGVKRAGKLINIKAPSQPFHTIGMDFVGPLTKTKRGNRYILVLVDYLTKWPEAFALPDQAAESVAKIVVEEIICRHGAPSKILSDRGKNFMSNLVARVLKLLDVEKISTTAYHPQTDGQVENENKTLITGLSMYTRTKLDNWDDYIPYVLSSIRTSVHASTGYTPFYMLHGREARMPLDVALSIEEEEENVLNTDSYADELVQKLKDTHKSAQDNITKAQERQKRNYDKDKTGKEFNVGDQVRVYVHSTKKGESSKFKHRWHGPYHITHKLSPVTYRVSDSKGEDFGSVINIKHLKLNHEFEELPSTAIKQPQSQSAQVTQDTENMQVGDRNDELATVEAPEEDSDVNLESESRTEVVNEDKTVRNDSIMPTNLTQIEKVLSHKVEKKKGRKGHTLYFVQYWPELNKPNEWVRAHMVLDELKRKYHDDAKKLKQNEYK
jgi:hypothetical protein